MSKVLVVGANGYIGKHVVEVLLRKGHAVVAVDVRQGSIHPGVCFVQMDILDDASATPDSYCALGSPDILIDLAWGQSFEHNNAHHLLNLPKHYGFLRALVAGGLSHLSVIGTMHEVGYWEGPITEDTPCNPMTLYGISKNALRQSLFALARAYPELTYQWLRAYYIVGDDLRGQSLFAKIARMEQEGAKTFPFTSGVCMYDFIDVETLAEQIVAASTQKHITGIINCCNGTPMSLRDKVEAYLADHHYIIRPDYGAYPDRPYDSPGVWGDAGKINQIMGDAIA